MKQITITRILIVVFIWVYTPLMKGKTIPCPDCKQILLRYCNFIGTGTFETHCPHCDKLVKVKIDQQPVIEVLILPLVAIAIFILTQIAKHSGIAFY